MQTLAPDTLPLNGRLLIEASAGTGKTYTISSLYLRLLLGRDPALDRPLLTSEILVLTFTIAATDELRTRIRERVSVAKAKFSGQTNTAEDAFIDHLMAESTDLTADRRLLAVALQTMDEAAIFTIHGFCAGVLSEQSFDAGMLFDQSLDGDRDLLLQIAAEDCFRSEIMPLPPGIQALALKHFRHPEAIANTVKKFLFRHNLHYLPPEQQEVDPQQLEQANIELKQQWLDENITQLLLDANLSGNKRAARRLKPTDKNFIEAYCHGPDFDPEAWLPFTPGGLEDARKAATVLPENHIFTAIEEFCGLAEAFEVNLYHRVSRYIKAHLQQSKVELGQLTLDDLLTEVHRAVQNPDLAGLLRARWPVAMIDEFQDTDDLQFEIFSAIYPPASTVHGSLMFIGDPKQAIYNFRGADVYTYINARLSADQAYSLDTNWRSTPAMVDAVNHLFQQPDSFGDDQQIRFEPVKSAPAKADLIIQLEGETPPPVSLFVDAAPSAAENRDNLMNHAAEETARLLNLAAEGKALIENQPITPGQIAFLVRSGRDARAARLALAKRNIRSVYVTLESVFLSETADDLKRILEAVLEPTNETALKSALGTRLMQSTAQEVFELSNDWTKLQDVMEEFQHYHHLWATMAVAPMIEALISQRKLAEKWLRHPDGDRQITNLRHLAELLQERSLSAPGMRRLLKWFIRERIGTENVAVESRQLRLESDSNLVQIVTMHASKGLEYDIVMIPSAGFGAAPLDTKLPLFHPQDDRGDYYPAIDFRASDTSKSLHRAEDHAETTRLLYVALTRARYRCYIGLAASRDILKTPLAKLLNLEVGSFEGISATLEQLPQALFTTQLLHNTVTAFNTQAKVPPMAEPLQLPTIRDRWRMHSYTGLTRLLTSGDESAATPQPRPGFGDDEQQGKNPEQNKLPSRFSFPRGAKVGIALHSFMENLDFAALPETVSKQAQLCIARLALSDEPDVWQAVLEDWFTEIVSTPLDAEFSLKDISAGQRLDEMEFHFPIEANQQLIKALKQSGVLPPHMQLSVDTLQGMMTGYIDLIVAYDNQFYLIDYKSNDLGPEQTAYHPNAVTEAVKHHHYDLQYLIYCVALNRYLAQRIPDYSYARHFGGVRYLFLRGMNGEPGAGVFSARPEQKQIETLDALLSGASHD
ncbi:MAG: exodeoxyribonuclease V subunit beta [Pseudomonadales bacterium]